MDYPEQTAEAYEYDKNMADHYSTESAETIAPLLVNMYEPRSVIDIGCGTGIWLNAFKKCGVRDVLGLDGSWIRNELLVIDKKEFANADLRYGMTWVHKFWKIRDMVICLETAEHLPETCAKQFVKCLVQQSDRIVFSAAVPGQGGFGHYNEQPHEYWHTIFAANDYAMHDTIRPLITADAFVQPWYRNNIFVYERIKK